MTEEVIDRAAIAAEVFGEPAKEPQEVTVEPIEKLEAKQPETPDPWAGVPAALREEVE